MKGNACSFETPLIPRPYIRLVVSNSNLICIAERNGCLATYISPNSCERLAAYLPEDFVEAVERSGQIGHSAFVRIVEEGGIEGT